MLHVGANVRRKINSVLQIRHQFEVSLIRLSWMHILSLSLMKLHPAVFQYLHPDKSPFRLSAVAHMCCLGCLMQI